MQNPYNPYNPSNLEALFKKSLLAENNSKESYNISLQSNTVRNYLSDLRFYFGWLARYSQTKPNPVNATQDDVSAYRSYLIESNLPYRTINRRLSTVRKFYSFCIDQVWIQSNPASGLENVKEHIVSSSFSDDTFNLLQEYETYLNSSVAQADVPYQISVIKEFLQTQ